jgi:1L-myo-inositol 1-phosphate cytidylyltransferase
VTKCLIVAAGEGSRLQEKGSLKPLVPILGTPLIERVINAVHRAGIDEFVVVSGYRGEELRAELDAFAARARVSITHAINPEWRRANGVSLLAGKPALDGPFLLTMCDHLVDPQIYRELIAAAQPVDGVTLAVDFNIEDPLNDPEDFTRVKCANGRIQAIGKGIKEFNAIDTGVFLCSPLIFAAAEASQAQGDDSISGAMTVLAAWNKAYVFDIGSRAWIDVDDPVAFAKAEMLLKSGRL